jgi:hypothetical protein
MKPTKFSKNESTFTEREPDMRQFEQAWREDFPNSKPVPRSKSKKIEDFGFYHD